MNTEDKRLISEYMGWKIGVLDWWRPGNDGYELVQVNLDLNDAGLCVKEMQRRGDLDYLVTYAEEDTSKQCHTWSQFFAWLYNADNFFEVMAKWLKEENK